MYPWLIGGTTSIGGNSTAPTNLKSFAGGFVNMVFMVSSMLSGACATPEFLMYMNYFIGKEYGTDYWKHPDDQADLSLKKRTIDKVITDYFEQIVYTLNQPTGARNYQAVFWNIAYYDKYYFESIFGDFYFPDGSKPDWESLSWLQKRFMKWFNKERTKTLLTFPVETMALLTDENGDCEITDNGFSYTLGAGGVSTGSKSVLTINLNRCIQFAVNHEIDYLDYLGSIIDLCHKVQLAYNENLKELQSRGMLPLFDAGYINISRQYLTIGINGLVEAAEFMGLKITPNDDYLHFVQGILGLIEKYNKKYRTKDVMFNCEMIPAENVGVKHAKWDREDGYFVPRDCYNSYFYVVEDDSLTIIDKFKLHGAPYIEHLTGGSALHMNLEEHLSKQQYMHLLKVAAQEGCNYFTFNIPNTVCNDCGYIDKRYLKECPHCHSKNVDYMTRIIGYLKRVSNFSQARQEEAAFQEIPDEVTLAINISNCPCHCPGCHSHYLWEDIGLPLNADAIDAFIEKYGDDITCISFMGGDSDPKGVNLLAQYIHEEHPQFKVAWYSGKTVISAAIDKQDFDYIKIGPFIKHLGPLKSSTTNQRLYRRNEQGEFEDITSRFWKK